MAQADTPRDGAPRGGLAHWLRDEALLRVRRHPWLFLPAIRWRQRRGQNRAVRLPDAHTTLVIEGFFRSANHYAQAALQLARNEQQDAMRLAGMSHAPAVVIHGCRHELPTLILVRGPRDVALSNYLKHPHTTLAHTLRGYIDFHERILPWRARYIVATFEQVTRDMNPVIDQLNARFALDLNHLPPPEEASALLAARLGGDKLRKRPLQGAAVADLPTPEKQRAKDDARAHLETPALRALLNRAEQACERFLNETHAIGA